MDTSKKMYKASHGLYGENPIDEIAVIKETDKTVILEGRSGWKPYRENKESSYTSIHSTWESAYRRLMSIAESKVEQAKLNLKRADDNLKKIQDLTKP